MNAVDRRPDAFAFQASAIAAPTVEVSDLTATQATTVMGEADSPDVQSSLSNQTAALDPAIVAGPFLIAMSDVSGSVIYILVARAIAL